MWDLRLIWRLVLVAVVVCLVWFGFFRPPSESWQMLVCDVGQGSATVLRDGPQIIMVDVGPDNGRSQHCLSEAGISRIAVVVLSHLDGDHVGGLEDVLDRVQVERIHVSAHGQQPDRLTELQQVAGGVPVTPLAAPVPAYSGDGLTLDTLWPDPQDGLSDTSPNEGSLVLAARWRDGATALLPGDIEAAVQDRLADSVGPRPGYDVVLVPHHGSGNHDAELPQALRPAVALVSVGAFNRYGHPVPEVLRGYQDAGAQVWRTDRHGTLALSWTEDRVVVDRW